MKIAYFKDQCAQNSGPVLDAFLHSCESQGHSMIANSMDGDAVVIWSMLWSGRMAKNLGVYQHYRGHGKPVFVLEVGALRRDHLWRVAMDHVNRRGYFGIMNNDDARAKKLGLQLQPWRHTGSHILVSLQRSDSGQWDSPEVAAVWLDRVIEELRSVTSRPIVIRPHPRQVFRSKWTDIAVQTPSRLPDTYDDYDFPDSLSDAWAVINWSSNPGIIAAMSGVPVFTGPDSLAAPVACQDLTMIENPSRPDRQQWLNDLAYCEWTVEEIAQGLPLARLMTAVPHHAAIQPRQY